MKQIGKVYGLTGQTGAGKTTVCQALREAGLAVIDCDRVARRVTEPGTPCLKALAVAFGPEIIRPDGSLDRKALGAAAFGHPERLRKLDDLIFPFILEELRSDIAALWREGASGVVLDAPTLFEAGADALCDEVIVVTAPAPLRRARIMERDGLTAEAAEARMASQKSESFFRAHADHLLCNDGARQELLQAARSLAAELAGRAHPDQ